MVADGPLTPFAEGVWVDSEPMRILGMRLTATMTVLRLSDNSLLLYSPVAMPPERRAAVEAIGPVTHLYAPNLYHHLWIGQWAGAFPSARLHAPARLAKKSNLTKQPRPRTRRCTFNRRHVSFHGQADIAVALTRLTTAVIAIAGGRVVEVDPLLPSPRARRFAHGQPDMSKNSLGDALIVDHK